MEMTKPHNAFLTSDRLYLREFVPSDWENIYQLDSDPEVMKYLSQFAMDDKSDYPKIIERCIAYYHENPGFGVWAVIEKESDKFIGWFMLKKYKYSDDQELGYRLMKKYWNRGYATEMSLKLIEYSFLKKNLSKIVAITHPENIASQKVLKKIGMKYIKTIAFKEGDTFYFEIEKEENK